MFVTTDISFYQRLATKVPELTRRKVPNGSRLLSLEDTREVHSGTQGNAWQVGRWRAVLMLCKSVFSTLHMTLFSWTLGRAGLPLHCVGESKEWENKNVSAAVRPGKEQTIGEMAQAERHFRAVGRNPWPCSTRSL